MTIKRYNKETPASRRFFASFLHAGRGIKHSIENEVNFKVFIVAAAAVIFLGFFLKVSITEWLILILTTCVMFIVEIFNTSLEVLCDRVSLKKDEQLRVSKDIAAAAVLTSSIMAVLVAVGIFLPKIIDFLT